MADEVVYGSTKPPTSEVIEKVFVPSPYELMKKAQEKGITLFLRGDSEYRMIFACFRPFSPDYQMVMGPQDEMYAKLWSWLDRYPDAEISEIWI